MTPYILKQKILTQISTLLGVYKLDSLVPAIWIGIPPQRTVATGLECLIPELPTQSKHGNHVLTEKWDITLTQYPATDGIDTINQATRILRSYLRPCDVVFVQKPKSSGDVYDIPFLPQSIISYQSKEILIIR